MPDDERDVSRLPPGEPDIMVLVNINDLRALFRGKGVTVRAFSSNLDPEPMVRLSPSTDLTIDAVSDAILEASLEVRRLDKPPRY